MIAPPAQAQTYRVLHSFTGIDGSVPYGSLIRDGAGNLYGTTSTGGAHGQGTVYKVDAHGNETVLYSFTGGGDGGAPKAGLVADGRGNLYGTTESGGFPGFGTVYKVDATGEETVLYNFSYTPDEGVPNVVEG